MTQLLRRRAGVKPVSSWSLRGCCHATGQPGPTRNTSDELLTTGLDTGTLVATTSGATTGSEAPTASGPDTDGPSATTTRASSRATSEEIAERLSLDLHSGRTMAEVLEEELVPGVTVAVVRDGEIAYTGAFGIDPQTRRPLEENTVFQVGSISKPVTAMGAAWLGQARALFWDMDVDEVLTSFQFERGSVARDEPITVERLLSHRGGINVTSFPGYDADEPTPTLSEVLRGYGNTTRIRANRPVGQYWYSGGGYTLLEQVMVDATGTPFIELMDDMILEPAGMVDSTFRSPLPQGLRAQMTSPSIDGQAVDARVHPEHAAAGLWSTAPDLARLLIAYQGALAGESNSLLDQRWAARLIEYSATNSFDLIVGHGWFLDRPENPQWFWHTGTNVGYNAEIIGSVDGRHGAVVLTNALDGQDIIADIFATIADIEGWQGSPR